MAMLPSLPDARGRTTQAAPKRRLSPRVKEAVELHIQEGYSRTDAAKAAGIKDDTFRRALRLPHVRAYIRQQFAELRETGPARAYHHIRRLADNSESERLQFDASRWIAGVDGLAPAKTVNISGNVSHSFDGYAFKRDSDGSANTIEQQVEDAHIIDDDYE